MHEVNGFFKFIFISPSFLRFQQFFAHYIFEIFEGVLKDFSAFLGFRIALNGIDKGFLLIAGAIFYLGYQAQLFILPFAFDIWAVVALVLMVYAVRKFSDKEFWEGVTSLVIAYMLVRHYLPVNFQFELFHVIIAGALLALGLDQIF